MVFPFILNAAIYNFNWSICVIDGRRGSVGKSAVLTPLGMMLELVVQTPLLPGISMCAFVY